MVTTVALDWDFRFRIHNLALDCFKLTQNMETYKPYTTPCIEVVDVVLESTVLQPSTVSNSTSITNLDEDDEEFVW